MNRKIKKADLYIGMLVVVSDVVTAQVRTITHIFPDSNMVEVQWKEAEKQCIEGLDCSMLMTPNIKQIEHTISAYGALVGVNDIFDLA